MHSTGIRLQQNAKKLSPKKSTHDGHAKLQQNVFHLFLERTTAEGLAYSTLPTERRVTQ